MNPQDFVVYFSRDHTLHSEPGHPERPERLQAIQARLQSDGLWEQFTFLDALPIQDSVLHAIHDPAHLQNLQRISARGGRSDEDTYLTPASYNLAVTTASGAATLAEQVWLGQSRSGIALSRPPGHHATRDQAMGFCTINNVAVAAEHLIQVHQAQRIAILDIDLHHGNGTQDIFYNRSDVLFASVHQFPLYPFSGAAEERGAAAGLGYTLNCPLPPYAGDQARLAFLTEIFLPQLEQFQPEMVLISLGLDAHWRDPLGHQVSTADGYAQIARTLTNWCEIHCDGRLALFLEGGYDLEAIAECTSGAIHAILDQPWQDALGSPTIPETTAWRSHIDKLVALL